MSLFPLLMTVESCESSVSMPGLKTEGRWKSHFQHMAASWGLVSRPENVIVTDYLLSILLNTLGKALETDFAHGSSDLAEANNLLPEQQIGAPRERSTETALEVLVNLSTLSVIASRKMRLTCFH